MKWGRQKTTDDRTGDQQVNVFRDREAPEAVLAALHDSLRREGQLREEVERYREEDSVNHALAGLLAKGSTKQTPFRERYSALFKSPTGVEFHVSVLASRNRDQVVIRYYEAHVPDEEPIPICAVARLARGQLKKKHSPARGSTS